VLQSIFNRPGSRAAVQALLVGASIVTLTGTALTGAATAQKGSGEKPVTYWMTADTTSGMAAMAANRGSMMRAAFGGGSAQPAYAHSLQLQLGSGRRAAGEPSAEHLPPQGLQAGPSLPLLTPRAAPAAADPQSWARNMEKPKGRILVYWGCGERARPGQPAVIDFASLTSGQIGAAFAATQVRYATPPGPGNNATYGEWPNQRSQTSVPASGSLVGEHVVRGNYTPAFKFALGAANDFLAPVMLTGNQTGASGAVPLAWRAVAGSKAWLASTVGAAENGDLIMWSSSERQAMPLAPMHLDNAEIARLVTSKVLLAAATSQCTVPAEVAKAAPQSALSVTAFGGEANFSQSPLPAGARPQWTVKLRTKSAYQGMLGVDMAALMRGGSDAADEDSGADEAAQAPAKPNKGDLIRRGLKGLFGG
jgi:hypothetical protein